jgi:hypothetical protein
MNIPPPGDGKIVLVSLCFFGYNEAGGTTQRKFSGSANDETRFGNTDFSCGSERLEPVRLVTARRSTTATGL